MDFTIKKFSQLSTRELFEVYKLRSQVFVVEQNCVYQDVDDKDLEAAHVLFYDKHILIGYSRILPPLATYKEPSIGRVVLAKEFRGNGFGKILMKQSLQ